MSFKFLIKASNHPDSLKEMKALILKLTATYNISVNATNNLVKVNAVSFERYYQVIYEFIKKKV